MSNLLAPVQYVLANFGPVFILLGLLIFVHELGHFLVAKYFGVRVETFSLGFGKKILSIKRGDTTYCISIIPLGGYVKMYGDDPSADVPAEEKKYAFLHKPLPQRFAIVLAGPLMNLFFAALIFVFIAVVGEEVPGPSLGDIQEDSKAYAVGFRSGDKILKINSEDTPTWAHVRKRVEKNGGRAVNVVVERAGEPEPLQFDVGVGMGDNEDIFSATRKIGQIPGFTQDSRSTLIGIPDPKSILAVAGVQTHALIDSINGTKVQYWRELEPILRKTIQPGMRAITLGIRDLEKPNKPENIKQVSVELPAKWDEKSEFTQILGFEPAEQYIYQVKDKSPAAVAGMISKDKVIRIDGGDVITWNDVLNKVKNFDAAKEAMEFVVLRDGEEKTFQVRPEMTKVTNQKGLQEHRYTIGIVSGFFPIGVDPVFHRLTDPIQIAKRSVEETWRWTGFVAMTFVRLIQLEVSPRNIGGVITIGRVASHSFEAGLSVFLRIMAIISINLFVINLFPVPVLDGGHLVFYTIEAIQGAPLSLRKMELAQQVGLMLLMGLMAFALFNDITNLFFNQW